MKKGFIKNYFDEIVNTTKKLNFNSINNAIKILKKVRGSKGRVFFAGVGGSAGNCSHAVNDFRKLCSIESYSISENVSELTARINDDGWDVSYVDFLKDSNFTSKDLLIIFSVGGGNLKKKVSVNLINCMKYAKNKNSKIISIVGKKDGFAYRNSDVVIFTMVSNNRLVTPVSESFQSIIWHCLVSHPDLQLKKTKW